MNANCISEPVLFRSRLLMQMNEMVMVCFMFQSQ